MPGAGAYTRPSGGATERRQSESAKTASGNDGGDSTTEGPREISVLQNKCEGLKAEIPFQTMGARLSNHCGGAFLAEKIGDNPSRAGYRQILGVTGPIHQFMGIGKWRR